MNNELYHYGVKGQKWGVRRYQFADGSYTPVGIKRYQNTKNSNNVKKVSNMMSMRLSEVSKSIKTRTTGMQYVDTYLSKGTTFSRIQSQKEFENFAFYATYKKADSNKYMGLFGKNLTSRAVAEARVAEKKAKKTGNEVDVANAKALREKSDSMKIYQLKITICYGNQPKDC